MTYDPHKAHECIKEAHKEIFEKSQKTSSDLLSEWEAEAKEIIGAGYMCEGIGACGGHREQHQILKLIDLVRKKDQALAYFTVLHDTAKTAIPNKEVRKQMIAIASEALSLTDDLKD